jgi:hypothetical protein
MIRWQFFLFCDAPAAARYDFPVAVTHAKPVKPVKPAEI